jgi:hypothetical protein
MDHLNKKAFLKLRIFGSLTLLALTAPPSVFALNLKEAKTPIHYECQTTHSGGVWKDEKTGEWMSGKVAPHTGKYRLVLERFDDTKGQRKNNCLEEERRTGGNKFKNSDFCLTFSFSRVAGQPFDETRYCMITSSSAVTGDSNNLICPWGRIFFDSDGLYGVRTDSPEFVELSPELTVTAKKFSCSRLDR